MEEAKTKAEHIGFVIIGRNEGERLKAGINSIRTLCSDSPVVYVDSGSTDGSVALVKSLRMSVVELDLSIPFTAARARNAGCNSLLEANSELEFIQFMDGDCELLPGWIDTATNTLMNNDKIGIVSGRRFEKFPQASIYNTLIDIEWNTPVGETLAVLGDLCVKVSVIKQIKGFSEQIIAAEDDDLCLRARRAGYMVHRLDADMSRHDANMMKMSQWYRRAMRAGHGYANINHLHGNGPDKYFRRELMRTYFWGGVVPIIFLLCLALMPMGALLVGSFYVLFVARTILHCRNNGNPLRVAVAYGMLVFTSKSWELMGVFQYWKNRLLSFKHQLIEYK